MAKTTRTNSASRGGLTLVEEDALNEALEPMPSSSSASDDASGERPSEDASSRLRPYRAAENVPAEEPFLRMRRRAPVRRGFFPAWSRTRWGRYIFAGLLLVLLGGGVTLIFAARNFLYHDKLFRFRSLGAVQTVGNSEVSRASILSVFRPDIGQDIFRVPLAQRRTELEGMPWVERATVMRILPNHLRVALVERKPVAFLRTGSRISLIDAHGVVLHLTPQSMARHHFNFPVVTGLKPDLSQAARQQRIDLYLRFVHALGALKGKVVNQISEVNLADSEDVRATITTGHHDLLLHFGHGHFAARYRKYAANIHQWLSQYPALVAVDLRYNKQVVLTMSHAVAPSSGNTGTTISRRSR